jgi:hypothetical protein
MLMGEVIKEKKLGSIMTGLIYGSWVGHGKTPRLLLKTDVRCGT